MTENELHRTGPRRGAGGRPGRARREGGFRFPPPGARSGLAALAALALAGSAEATHAVDHRYLVLGYVRDRADRPVPRREVRVIREKTRLSYPTTTDAAGFYLVVVHLHDEDLGDALGVATGSGSIHVQAGFDRRDATSHRGTRVDFWDGQALERRDLFPETLEKYLKD